MTLNPITHPCSPMGNLQACKLVLVPWSLCPQYHTAWLGAELEFPGTMGPFMEPCDSPTNTDILQGDVKSKTLKHFGVAQINNRFNWILSVDRQTGPVT